jgi:hypothetical protein
MLHQARSPRLQKPPAGSRRYESTPALRGIVKISAHSERHTKQILEVKADPNFPKK